MNRSLLLTGVVNGLTTLCLLLGVSPAAQAQDTTGSTGPADSTESTAATESATDSASEGSAQEAPTEDADAQPADADQQAVAQATEQGAGAQPTDGAESNTSVVSSATQTPNETEASAEEPAPPAPAQLPWRNSFFSWTNGVTLNTFVPNGQPTYNPTFYMSFFLLPRWYLSNQTFFVVQAGASIELTDDDFSARNRELQLFDSVIELRHNIAWEGFIVIPAARVTFPTSRLSIAAQRYVNLGVGLSIARPFPEIAGLTLALTGAFRRWIAGSNVPLTQSSIPCQTAASSAGGVTDVGSCDASGVTSTANRVLIGLTANIAPAQGLTITFQGLYIADEGFGVSTAYVGTGAGPVQIPDGASTHWRHFTYLTLGVGYDVLDWLNLQLSYANSTVFAPVFTDDGNIRSPFNPDSQVLLSATVQLDALYNEVNHGDEGDDGLTPEQRQRRRQGLE